MDSFRINIFRENLIDDIISIIKQNGFKQVNRIVNSTQILIKIPEPTQNQLNEFAGETKELKDLQYQGLQESRVMLSKELKLL